MYKPQDRSPGPAAYNPSFRPVVRSPPAFTLAAKRRPEPNPAWRLGPGTYYPRLGPAGPAYSLHGRLSPDLNQEKMWLLEPSKVSNPRGGSGGWTPRRFLVSEVTPGPGTYSLPGGNSGPAFSVAAKRTTKHETDAPGPGTYFYTNRPQSPSYTMADRFPASRGVHPSPRTVFGEFCNTPGPAQYNPDRGKTVASKSGPAYTINGKWHAQAASGLPGPGTYYPPQNNTFGQDIGCRHSQKVRKHFK